MSLPDRLERVGIVVGSIVMLGIPLGALGFALFPPSTHPLWMTAAVQVLPAAAVGLLVADGRLPLTYQEVWRFGIAFWLVAIALGAGLGVNAAGEGTGPALRVWAIAVVLAAVVATHRRWRAALRRAVS